ncbi:MAG: S41 family peptidase [Chlorobi bacterium]|nr:S41 family peptidase [Chlorobiota bacterium]
MNWFKWFRKKAKVMNRRVSIVIVTVFLSAFSFLALTEEEVQETYFQIVKWIEIYSASVKELITYYVDPVPPEKLVKNAIEGMTEILDPYTEFIPEEKMDEFRMQSTGKYGGIGAVVSKRDSLVMIADPYIGFPAYKAGLRAGDYILKINGRSVVGWKLEDVTDLLRGTPGSKVTVTVYRPFVNDTFDVVITRAEIKIDPITYANVLFRDSSIYYIKLRSFTQGLGRELRQTLRKALEEHKPEGIILDLRGNPGGLLNEAILVANVFIPQGKIIVTTKGRIPEWERVYRAPLSAVDTSTPLAVLVNGSSASASEIVAGAIQDWDRGVVIGETTFGKGLVQTTRNLPYNAKLKLTIARYYTPSGRSIQALIYTHKHTGKKAIEVPDSLREEFKTDAGRTVYSGNGIEPDVKIELPEMPHILRALIRENIIFDFATKFYHEHDTIPPPVAFQITKDIYEEFVQFVKSRNFKYETPSDKKLKQLKEQLKKDKFWNEEAEKYVSGLKEFLEKEKERDIYDEADLIKWQLEQEIVRRYYGQKGAIEAFLEKDIYLDSALVILKDTERYKKVLSP